MFTCLSREQASQWCAERAQCPEPQSKTWTGDRWEQNIIALFTSFSKNQYVVARLIWSFENTFCSRQIVNMPLGWAEYYTQTNMKMKPHKTLKKKEREAVVKWLGDATMAALSNDSSSMLKVD